MRPCKCEKKTCRLCYLYHNDVRYKALWDDGEPGDNKDDDEFAEHCPCAGPKPTASIASVIAPVIAPAKRALITLNIGGVLTSKSRASFQAAARRWSVDYHEITSPLSPVGGRPHWQKTFLARWAADRGYGQCVYYDADILIRSDCPNVLDLVPPGHIGVCANDQIDGAIWKPGSQNRYYSSLAWWANRLNLRCPPLHEHANSGMIVFDTRYHQLFDRWRIAGELAQWGAPTKLIDQAPFSVLLHNLHTDSTRTWLPMMFNALIYRTELIRHAGQMQAFVYHYTGQRKHHINDTEWQVGRGGTMPAARASERAPSPILLGNTYDPASLFERCVVINLDRRHDRINAFRANLPQPWPFVLPDVARAIDVDRCPAPSWYTHEAGQWGCARSHVRVIEDALNDGVESLLVFEDDAAFRPGFLGHVQQFLASVPNDWEILFLGGAHTRGRRRAINAHVEIPGYVTLAHAYALRGNGLRLAYEAANQHTPGRAEFDHRLGQLAESGACAAYAPRGWLVYQTAGFSDLKRVERPLRGVVASEIR